MHRPTNTFSLSGVATESTLQFVNGHLVDVTNSLGRLESMVGYLTNQLSWASNSIARSYSNLLSNLRGPVTNAMQETNVESVFPGYGQATNYGASLEAGIAASPWGQAYSNAGPWSGLMGDSLEGSMGAGYFTGGLSGSVSVPDPSGTHWFQWEQGGLSIGLISAGGWTWIS